MKVITVDVDNRIPFIEFIQQNHDIEYIFLVYRRNREDNRLRLIYIGENKREMGLESSDWRQHPRYQNWIKWAYNDENALVFSIVKVAEQELKMAFDAMVLAFRPSVNSESGEVPSHIEEEVIVNFSGRNICGRPFVRVGDY